jgi:hypothetical protein
MPFNSLQKPDKTFAHFNSLPNHKGNRNMTSSPPSGQKLQDKSAIRARLTKNQQKISDCDRKE